MRAALWIDAGARAGGGHVARAVVLGAALRARGVAVDVFARDARAVTLTSRGQLCAREVSDDALAPALAAEPPDLLFVDLSHLRPAPTEVLAACAAQGICIVSFDASDPALQHSEGYVNAAIPALHDDGGAGAGPLVRCLGTRHAIVDPQALCGRRLRRAKIDPPRLLVAFGASDPAGLSALALDALAGLERRLAVDVFVGELVAAPERERIVAAAAALPDCRIHGPALPPGAGASAHADDGEATGDERMREPLALVRQADFGLMSFGTLFFAAASNGLPCWLWNPSAAHTAVTRRFLAGITADSCGEGPGPPAIEAAPVGDVDGLRGALRRACDDRLQTERLSRAALARFDGQGAERTVACVLDHMARRRGPQQVAS